MKILYGTGNPAKLKYMKEGLAALNLEIIGLRDLEQPLSQVEENGSTPLQNAQIKAEAYYKAFHMPVFSCDSGLYFEEVPAERQPGVFVRRAPDGHEMDDVEMTAHYAALAKEFGGRLTARYRNAICLILDETHRYLSMDDSLAGEPYILCNTPHERREKGFPLDCLSLDIATGKYYYDLPAGSYATEVYGEGFRRFFEEALRDWKAEK